MTDYRLSSFNKTFLTLITFLWSVSAFTAEETIYFGQPRQTKVGTMPACTTLIAKESRGKVSLRDINKSWPKFRFVTKDYEKLPKFSDFSKCVSSVASYNGRYQEIHLTNLMLGNLMPGMPSEFALMLLGPPSQPPSVSSFIDPLTGQPKTYSFFIWNNQQKRNLLGSALTIAGAATGMSAAAGSLAATQAASLATTAAAAAYSLENLKSARVITIQVDEKNIIQTFSSN